MKKKKKKKKDERLLDAGLGGSDALRLLEIAVEAEGDERSPAGGNEASRTTSSNTVARVNSSGPFGVDEIHRLSELWRAEHHDARSLDCVSVFVGVG